MLPYGMNNNVLEQLGELVGAVPGTGVTGDGYQPHGDMAYIEGFVKQCADKGLPEEQTSALLQRHLLEKACETDPAFGRGFQSMLQAAATQ